MKKLLLLPFFICSFSFKKTVHSFPEKSAPASSYSSKVLDKWMAMQIKLMSSTPAIFNGPFVRIYSYTGLAAFRSIFPGIARKSPFWFSESALNNLHALPGVNQKERYHWPSSLNAAMAFMNRSMFPSEAAGKRLIDSLEEAIRKSFSPDVDAATLKRSADYGLSVAQRVYAWSEADGYQHANDKYSPPSGPGKWIPTPPKYSQPVTPHWGSLRTMVSGSIINAQPPAPIPYSEDSSSAFYKQVKEVYDISQNIKPQQKEIALYWKEINPGITAPGHWLNILRQIIQKENSSLDQAAFAYAITGLSLNDAWISCWKTRYVYNLLRPVTYIRHVMRHDDWLSLVPTPPHPEYTSGFAAMAAAVCRSLAHVFGNDYQLTDHTYDYAGMKPRTYYSFRAMAKEAGDSKIFGGIHYRFSVEAGLQEGNAVADNILKVLFQKVEE